MDSLLYTDPNPFVYHLQLCTLCWNSHHLYERLSKVQGECHLSIYSSNSALQTIIPNSGSERLLLVLGSSIMMLDLFFIFFWQNPVCNGINAVLHLQDPLNLISKTVVANNLFLGLIRKSSRHTQFSVLCNITTIIGTKPAGSLESFFGFGRKILI